MTLIGVTFVERFDDPSINLIMCKGFWIDYFEWLRWSWNSTDVRLILLIGFSKFRSRSRNWDPAVPRASFVGRRNRFYIVIVFGSLAPIKNCFWLDYFRWIYCGCEIIAVLLGFPPGKQPIGICVLVWFPDVCLLCRYFLFSGQFGDKQRSTGTIYKPLDANIQVGSMRSRSLQLPVS